MGHKTRMDRHRDPGAASPRGMEALKAIATEPQTLKPKEGYYWASYLGRAKEIVHATKNMSHWEVCRIGDERIYPTSDFVFLEKVEDK